MNRWVRMIVLLGGASCAVQAVAVEAANRQPSPRRLLVACMNKHMAASRTISYNEASALCKAQLKAAEPPLESNAQPKPVNGLGR
jgi:hypothetical protein